MVCLCGSSIVKDGFKLPIKAGALGKAIYFSRCALTAFWFCEPKDQADKREPNTRVAVGKLLLCAVDVGRVKKCSGHDPSLTYLGLLASGYDCASIIADELYPTDLIADETAVFDPSRCRISYILTVEVSFVPDNCTGALRPGCRGSNLISQFKLGQLAKLREELAKPSLQFAGFEHHLHDGAYAEQVHTASWLDLT